MCLLNYSWYFQSTLHTLTEPKIAGQMCIAIADWLIDMNIFPIFNYVLLPGVLV